MGYTPYKMLGHELPGIKQRTPATLKAFGTKDSDMPEKVSQKSGVLYKEGSGVGDSPAKELLMHEAAQGGVGRAMNKLLGSNKVKTGAASQGVAPHGDEAHTGGGEAAAVAGEEAPWEVMKVGAFGDMNKGERRTYMQGLDKDQRKQQIMSNLKTGGIKGLMSGGGLFGGGSGGGGLGGAVGGLFSDIRLKEKIEKTGKSPSGIPTYEFNYIGDNNRYSGVMAQDLIEMNIDAVSMDDSGFYKVNYNNIDVDMHLIN